MDDALTAREQELIKRYGDFYRALNGGRREPQTPDQVRFVEVCRGHAEPLSEHEVAFAKYVRLVKAERTAECARDAAAVEKRAQELGNEPGQYSYPSRLDSKFDSAAAWARKNGFRGV